MAGQFETANTLAILAGGRSPQWVEQSTYLGAPTTDGDGVYLEDALKALVDVKMREEVHRRTARVSVSALVLAETYTVTINATACAAAGPHASLAALLTAIKAAIDAGVPGVVTTSITDEDGDTVNDTVKIVGVAETDYTIDISATGAAVLACVADPTTATARVFVTMGGTDAPTGWRMPINCEYTLDKFGLAERFDVAGNDRMYVGLYSVDGAGDGASVTYTNVAVSIGPCVAES